MKLTKAQRLLLYSKYKGKCAYCGEDLPIRWHADHIVPIYRNDVAYIKGNWVDGTKYELDIFDNLNPACPPCNNYKHTLSLEGFRRELSQQVERAKTNCNFRLAVKYGQIKIEESPIIFYFERE